MKKIILISYFLLFVTSVIAQKRDLRQADSHYSYEEYGLAIPLYEQYLLSAQENSKQTLEVYYKLAYCYLQSAQKGKALPFLEKVHQKNPTYHKNLAYYLAQSYHLQHQWAKAEVFYKQVATTTSEYIKDLPKRLEECRHGREYTSMPLRVSIENMGDALNSSFAEYVPVISEDESVLMFTSRRASTTGASKDPADQEYYEDIYVSEKKNSIWSEPMALPRPINGNSHDACIALSPDGKTLFVYKTGIGKEKLGDIYVSQKTEAGWSNPKSLGDRINTKYREPSISITHDGKTIYFSSDRPGGFGGLDIYKSTLDLQGEWSEPTNLGATINTAYEEDSPFIYHENTLYFSSEGHSSMGGYDIFSSNVENNEWKKPVNIGYPLNTADDDIYFVVSADNKRGYFSSSRPGGLGEKDLYVVRLPELQPVKVAITNQPAANPTINIDHQPQKEKKSYITLLKGTITDAKTQEKLLSAVTLVDLADNIVEEELQSQMPTLGKYEATLRAGRNYLITVSKEGYLFHSENFNIPPQGEKNQEIVVDIALYRLSKGEKINLKVFYDFDKDFLRPESRTELERLFAFLQKYPKLKVEIAGHTDAVGTDTKNQGLSERRASSVVRYLIERGIDSKRLVARGYGETKPIHSNDTPEDRQNNRRTECEVLDF